MEDTKQYVDGEGKIEWRLYETWHVEWERNCEDGFGNHTFARCGASDIVILTTEYTHGADSKPLTWEEYPEDEQSHAFSYTQCDNCHGYSTAGFTANARHNLTWVRMGRIVQPRKTYMEPTGASEAVDDGCGGTTMAYALKCENRNEGRWHYDVSPVIIDVLRVGSPDLLSGGDWRKGRAYRRDANAVRRFNMDGLSPGALWEWVGPKSGLLVWSDDGSIPVQVSGLNLFGNRTWGKFWKHGYQPMAVLDVDKNGWLEGAELDHLYIWLDGNSNATVDMGEMAPVKQYVKRLSVRFNRDDKGNVWADGNGALLNDGTWVSSWDWWSGMYMYPSTVGADGRLKPVAVVKPVVGSKSDVVLYKWRARTGSRGARGGVFRFLPQGAGDYIVSSIVDNSGDGFIAGLFDNVNFASGEGSWKFGSLVTYASLVEEGRLVGRSILPNGEVYEWEAWPVADIADVADDLAGSTALNADLKEMERLYGLGVREMYFEPSRVNGNTEYELGRLKQ